MGTYRATVEYDGARYCGFQIQASQPTIQGELERSLQRVTQCSVRVEGAGRTDAGVHARGQVISFAVAWAHRETELQRAMNATLPHDIAVRDLAPVDPGFSARYSATSREYVYRILNSAERAPLWERYTHRVVRPLDMDALAEAASLLVGQRDFAAFGQAPTGENTVRSVLGAAWRREWAGGVWPLAAAPCDEDALCTVSFTIEANAFLRGMVRRLVGTLLEVGLGRLALGGFNEILLSREISRAAAPAPAQGLVLWRVYYAHTEARGECSPPTQRP